MFSGADLATIALTSRLVPSRVKPLSGRDYWPLARRADLGKLPGRDAATVASETGVPLAEAARLATLLDRSTAVALALEQLEQLGVWVLPATGDGYPARLIERLADAAPPVLHGVGEPAHIKIDGLGVVGSRDPSPESVAVARGAAAVAVGQRWPLVSGAARGIDQQAMNGAFEQGGTVVGVLADALSRAVEQPVMRRAIHSGQVCLITPYAPSAGFTAGSAMGRNKLIYALSRVVLVVQTAAGSGGTWAGAVEAARHGWTDVRVWSGSGAGEGNESLLAIGGSPCADILELATVAQRRIHHPTIADQLALGV